MEFLNRPASNYGTAAWLCGLIRCLRLPDPLSTCLAYVIPETGNDTVSLFTPASEFGPAWFAVRFEDRILVAIDGATTAAQVNRLVDAYTGSLQSGWRDPDNFYLQSNADGIVTALRDAGMTGAQKWTIAGWSLGGAIAPLMPANQVIRPWFDNFVEVVSFGAPRPGGETVARFINSRCTLTRYMNDTDPIPLCPPRVDAMPSLPLIIGIRPAQRWSQTVQPQGGCQLGFNGEISRVAVPTLGVIQFPLSLAAWYLPFDIGVDNTHFLEVYRTRLNLANARERNHSLPPNAPRENVQPMRRADFNAAERQAEQQVIAIERRQNAVPLNIPKDNAATVQKVGSMYYVIFRGQPVVSGRNRRKAYGIKNDLNRMLDRLQTAAMVDTDHFAQVFAGYLADASDPASAFVPTMNTSWPTPPA